MTDETHRIAVILLSGGIDSTTCMAVAKNSGYDSIQAVSFNYGQRHSKELAQAAAICKLEEVPHTILKIPKLEGSLTDESQEIPNISYDDIEGVSPTYVAFRNGTFLSLLTAHVHGVFIPEKKSYYETLDKENTIKVSADIYFGAHASDAAGWAYPDCTPEFIGAMANAIFIGTYQEVRLKAPLMELDKAGVVLLGSKLNTRYELTWSCYKGGEHHCGTCPTCRDRRDAFKFAGVADPTYYAKDI